MLNAVKNIVRSSAGVFGCYVGRLPLPHTLEAHLKILFSRLNINCVLDVGAHFGEYGLYLRNLGYRGHIISFEPIGENFEVLAQRAASDPRWKTYPFALGATEGAELINVMSGTDLSSFLPPASYIQERFGEHVTLQRTEQVEVKRLEGIFDACVEHLDEDAHVFLKMDTQGYDLQVLKGAGTCLDRISAIQTELSVRPLYDGMESFPDSIACLNELGFEITGLFPVTRDLDHLRIIEVDCVMRRIPQANGTRVGEIALT